MGMSPYEVFLKTKQLVSFSEEDAKNLVQLQEVLGPEIPAITNKFYEVLLREEGTAGFVQGRVEELKKAHIAWFEGVLQGTYEQEFFDRQFKIGLAHVRIGLMPYYVEGIMSVIRIESLAVIAAKVNDAARMTGLSSSLIKILDLNLAIINLSYYETRLKKLTEVTGLSRALLENLILQG